MHSKRYNKASSRIAQRAKTRRNIGLILRVVLASVVLLGIVTVFRAGFLQVDAFEVEGEETLAESSLQNAASAFSSGSKLFILPNSNIIFLDKKKLADALLSEFGRLESVEVNKNYMSHSIKLSIKERNADFLWCLSAQTGSESDKCFFMNKEGLVFEELSDAAVATADQVIFRGNLSGDPFMKNFALPEEMRNYMNFMEILSGAGFNVDSINIESGEKAVAITDRGDVVFSPDEGDLSLVAQNVILLMDEIKSKNPSASFEYIDARFGNKIFYKLK